MRKERKDNHKKSQSRGFDRDGKNFSGSFQSGPRHSSFSTPREMHKATCAECGNECEVPFKPTEGKPVYCRDCFRKRSDRF